MDISTDACGKNSGGSAKAKTCSPDDISKSSKKERSMSAQPGNIAFFWQS